jgi:hypothetical protein
VALSGLPRLPWSPSSIKGPPCLLSRAAARSSGRLRCRRRQSTGPAVTIGKCTLLILDRAGEQAIGQNRGQGRYPIGAPEILGGQLFLGGWVTQSAPPNVSGLLAPTPAQPPPGSPSMPAA